MTQYENQLYNFCNIHIRTYFISSQLNSICGEKSSWFTFCLQQSTILFSIPSSQLVSAVDFIGIGPKMQILGQNIKSLYMPNVFA
jgi:hypothetical protein